MVTPNPADLSAHRTRTNRRPERECEQWPPPVEFIAMQEPPYRVTLREQSQKN